MLPAVPSRTPAARPGPVLSLRAATRTHHDRIDRLIDLRRLADPAYYARVLQVFDAFLAGWEARALAALPRQGRAWLRQRSRRGFLQQDLRVLGIAPCAAATVLPVLPTAAAAWGSIYVMEGSAVGGQLITRKLAGSGLSPDRGAAYFNGWGVATGAMWHEARAVLDGELAEPESLDQACRAACATFDALSHLLERSLHERGHA